MNQFKIGDNVFQEGDAVFWEDSIESDEEGLHCPVYILGFDLEYLDWYCIEHGTNEKMYFNDNDYDWKIDKMEKFTGELN